VSFKPNALVARWNSYFDADEMSRLKETGIKGLMRVVEFPFGESNAGEGSILDRNLRRMVGRLKKSNVNIYILKQVPSINDKYCAQHVFMLKQYTEINQMENSIKPKLDPLLLRDNADRALVLRKP